MQRYFVIQFIYGWNQYLCRCWSQRRRTCTRSTMGIKRMIAGGDAANDWNLIMATAILAMLPPAIVVLLMQRWFVKGLVETENKMASIEFIDVRKSWRDAGGAWHRRHGHRR